MSTSNSTPIDRAEPTLYPPSPLAGRAEGEQALSQGWRPPNPGLSPVQNRFGPEGSPILEKGPSLTWLKAPAPAVSQGAGQLLSLPATTSKRTGNTVKRKPVSAGNLASTSLTISNSAGKTIKRKPVNGAHVPTESPDTEEGRDQASRPTELPQSPQHAQQFHEVDCGYTRIDNQSSAHAVEEALEKDRTHGKQEEHCRPIHRWRSPWLNKIVFLSFALLFAALAAAVLLLYIFGQNSDGVSTQLSSNHYTWTYGPTALLTLIAIIWSGVDLEAKALAPWRHLARGAEAADNNLLLDYLSPITPLVMIRAWKRKDKHVTVISLGLYILQGLIILSTGLLVLAPTTVKYKSQVTVSSRFKGQQYPHFLPDIIALRLYGILIEGMEFPAGTMNETAFDSFETEEFTDDTELIVPLNAFVPSLRCEIAQTTSRFWWDQVIGGAVPLIEANVSTTICPTFPADISVNNVCDPAIEDCRQRTITGWTDFVASIVPSRYFADVNNARYDDDPCGNLLAVYMTDVSYESKTTARLNSFSAIVCQPSYTMGDISLSYNLTGQGRVRSISPALSSLPPRNLDGFSIYNMSSYMISTISQGVGGTVPSTGINKTNDTTSMRFDEFISFMSMANDNSPLSAFLDPNVVLEVTPLVYQRLAVLTVGLTMRYPDTRHVLGSLYQKENRLNVVLLNTAAMTCGFVLLTIISSLLALKERHVIGPDDPSRMVTQLLTLRKSKGLWPILTGTGPKDDKELEKTLKGQHFQLVDADPWPEVWSEKSNGELRSKGNYSHNEQPQKSLSMTWSRPLATRSLFLLGIGLASLVVIAALEALYRISESNRGILVLNRATSLQRSAPQIISSFILWLISLPFSSVDFTSRSLLLFQRLRARPMFLYQMLKEKKMEKIPMMAFWRALKFRSLNNILASVAVTLSSYLTIIAAGLFLLRTVPISPAATIIIADRFDMAKNASAVKAYNATLEFTIQEWANGSYPKFVYDEVALPAIEFDRDKSTVSSETPEAVRLSMTGLRGTLDCSITPSTAIGINYTFIDDNTWRMNVSFEAPLPPGCDFWQLNYNTVTVPTPTINLWTEIESARDDQDVYYGKLFPPNNTLAPECPSFLFFIGHFYPQDTAKDDVTFLTCVQAIEKVEVEATFLVPSLELDPSNPPQIDESSAKRLGLTVFPFSEIATLDWSQFYQPSQMIPSLQPENTVVLDYTNFFGTLIRGVDAIPESELVGVQNHDRLINATSHLYGKYMAQSFNMNMRTLLTPDEQILPENQLKTTIRGATQVRLTVDYPSKLTLQLLLGVAASCAIAAVLLGSMRHTLPHSPTTIAGILALFAESSLKDPSTGSLVLAACDAGVRTITPTDDVLVSLGWWKRKQRDNETGTENGSGSTNMESEHGGENGDWWFGIDVGRAEKWHPQQKSGFLRSLRLFDRRKKGMKAGSGYQRTARSEDHAGRMKGRINQIVTEAEADVKR